MGSNKDIYQIRRDRYIEKKRRRKRRRRRRIFKLIFIIGLCTAMFKMFNYCTSLNKELITTDSISYYINIADKYSKPKLQLNWKEIASIYGAKNEGELNEYEDELIKEISNSFYSKDQSSADYKVKKFETVIEDIDLTKNEKKKAIKLLYELKDVSIAEKIQKDNGVKQEFISKIEPSAKEIYYKYKVFPSVAMAQAILESNWGRSELASNYNNYYGIKADKSWKGERINFSTKENYNDTIKADFRVYNSVEESVFDLGKFLNENSRYKQNGVFSAKNYIEQAEALKNAGYSTATNSDGKKIYADLLIQIIRENNLMIYDCDLNAY